MKTNRVPWRWREGTVDRAEAHFELRYGSARQHGWDDWLPVALVGRPTRHTFTVEFLTEGDGQRIAPAIVTEVRRELDFYLVENREPNPWRYAQDHCATGENVYSSVHWLFFPEKQAL